MRVTRVLREALAKTKKVAVGQLIMHGREHLVGITALYADTRSAWTPNFGGNGWESYAKGNTSSSKNLKHARGLRAQAARRCSKFCTGVTFRAD